MKLHWKISSIPSVNKLYSQLLMSLVPLDLGIFCDGEIISLFSALCLHADRFHLAGTICQE